MIEIIFQYLKQADYPENFVLELVESEEVTDYQYIEQFAESIHNHGAKIAIDDFGSGFSNLLHIIKINADILKIDGEIIKVICQDENCREFVTMINEWCRHTGKEVVGEFVALRQETRGSPNKRQGAVIFRQLPILCDIFLYGITL